MSRGALSTNEEAAPGRKATKAPVRSSRADPL